VIARADATFAHNKLSHHPRGQTAVGYVEIDEPAWSVARLNDEIAAILESAADRFPTYVVGEVSDATAKGYGTFFTLRDVEATTTSTAGGITPRSGHNTRSSTTSAPQSTSTASRHPTTNSSSGTNSTRIRELSSCSMRSTKLKPEHHLRSPQPAAVCNYLHREQRRGAVQPRRRPFREPPALYTSGWTSTTTSNYTTF